MNKKGSISFTLILETQKFEECRFLWIFTHYRKYTFKNKRISIIIVFTRINYVTTIINITNTVVLFYNNFIGFIIIFLGLL